MEKELYCDWIDALDIVTNYMIFSREDQVDELQGLVEQVYCEHILMENSYEK